MNVGKSYKPKNTSVKLDFERIPIRIEVPINKESPANRRIITLFLEKPFSRMISTKLFSAFSK